ncbi:tRNA dimethylallyltransferase [Sphingobacterium sp. E70]|uniref:tRNA dimethylallyltransferase n=1 Tax=Sphingobacterium sp. E70 TaxID=2853439 RepID=UPI00211BF956|nr:tRNA dimethylallyltransferase [Sphingobacterium sp. E70]
MIILPINVSSAPSKYWSFSDKTDFKPEQQAPDALVIGLNPALEKRRSSISKRLNERIENGFLQEVEQLLADGISHDQLQYYGLEYKYASFYLLGQLDYSTFFTKLETEIHRYAKRQMTYFRKMEKMGSRSIGYKQKGLVLLLTLFVNLFLL